MPTMAAVQTCYESAAVWSDSSAMPDEQAGLIPVRRGQVWLAPTVPSRGRRVLVIAPGIEDGRLAIVAPLAQGPPGTARVALYHDAVAVVVEIGRLHAMHSADLAALVTTLADDRMRDIDAAIRELLGLALGGGRGHDADATEAPHAGEPPHPVLAPPPPPRAPLLSAPQQVGSWEPSPASIRLEDHPMARLFGQTPPALPAAAPSAPPCAAAPAAPPRHDERSAEALPELLELVRRRLHRSSSHLEGLIVDSVGEGRTIDWTAAAVRRASVRGVMQSTLDDIAAEMESVAARDRAGI